MTALRSPQQQRFNQIIRLKRINSVLIYIILACSIAVAIIPEHWAITEFKIKDLVNALNIFAMAGFAILTFTIDFKLFPEAEKVRREDFIDNSFGTLFNTQPSTDYFSNEQIGYGIYKAAVNLFENCLFTLRISARMRLQIIIKNGVFAVLIFFIAYAGMKDSKFISPILQLFLSANVLGEMVKHLIFVRRNEEYLESLKTLFRNTDFKNQADKLMPEVVKVYVDYESNLAWATISLNSKIYQELNPIVSKEWDEFKQHFSIN